MGRTATGVRGMRLKGDDEVIQMDVIRGENGDLLIVTQNGLGKRTALVNYRSQGRGGSGVKTANLNPRTGKVVGAEVIIKELQGDLIIISKLGQIIRLPLESIPTRGRATQGVYLMRMKNSGDIVASISIIRKDEDLPEDQLGENNLKEEAEEAPTQPTLV